ncbi:P-loop containing nucleoside triphosphate hydrolase protein [Karstenula rhodostoma CBS 690.94]|uniref:P-loop containing nucleoside triphosphate hydrolase protein n=1 Tax=Karstenula rhodostoma CBS 690.94 TaxID=1392251 RepID=A0A9P4U686_9PLEO|nr:P-loop containing nucleoside triphosphate hydrolase protein [Karstenula rhodostoma CBS 690.94]
MNPHLTERFRAGQPHHEDDYPDLDIAPLARPSRINGDIWKYCQDANKPVANAGSWVNKPEIPTISELLPDSSIGFTVGEQIIDFNEELRQNKVEGNYESKEEYLGTHYDLLREDAVRPLRQAVEEVRKDPWRDESDYPPSSGIGIYEPVYLKAVQFSFRGLSAKVAFSLSRVKKLIRWNQSKRLITGTLVALSPADDAFQDPSKCLLAIVGARPLTALESNNPPEIDLFFVHPEQYDWDPARKWIMVESRSSFFEASRHTLLALQHMMREPFPLSEHLVEAERVVKPPDYVRLNPHTDLSPLVSLNEADQFQDVDILQEWPTGDNLTLDSSQSKALKRIMTKKLAIVQGPPGTGKTYVSVVALQNMLQNTRKEDPPIIVTCQTNHALDQLLRHIAEFEPNFIRLGGQTKDQDKIKKRTLYEVRSTFEQPKLPGSRKNRATGALRQLTAKMQLLLVPFERGKGPLDHRLLAKLGLLTEKQAASLEVDAQSVMGIPQSTPSIQMEQWLGRCLERCDHPYQPDDFGMPYEEEDFDEAEQLKEIEAEAVARDDDDDIEALKGPITAICDNFRGLKGGSLRTIADVQKRLDETDDLTITPLPDRGAIYNYLLRKAKQIVLREFRDLAKQYTEQVHLKKIGQWEGDQGILLNQRVIGMTTTGLSKYRALISSLRPRVVLIEEAAETLEAPVTAACFPTLEHLVLVGDHQQLRPHCNVHELEARYNMNVSLFERLVSNSIEHDTLRRQRRMIPEIRRLLQPIYGDKLKDHPSVLSEDNRPPVEGMCGVNSFFFTHDWPESRDNNHSAKNEQEAAMIVGFFDYLVLNGIDPAKITVLTFYNGQRKLLLSRLRRHQNLCGHPLKVVTVDSYQGEENDIVLLSLVRSPKDGNIGFLSVDNRVCVALSRARRGFYLFGNAEKLVCGSDTWETVIKVLWGRAAKKDTPTSGPSKRIGYHLPLTCQRHGNTVFIEDPRDWERLSGGCGESCRCLLPCGHTCMLTCHPFDSSRIICMQQCNKPCTTCGQACSQSCSDPCKCTYCERRTGGRKALIKPLQKTSTVQQALPNSPFHAHPTALPAAPTIRTAAVSAVAAPTMAAPDTVSEHSGSTPKQWQDYANGGVKTDDAQAWQKKRKEAARFQELISNGSSASSPPPSGKLIQVSPKKEISAGPSANTTLLIDLLDDDAPALAPPLPSTPSKSGNGRMSYKEKFSYVGDITSPIDDEKDGEGGEKENGEGGEKASEQRAPAPVFNLLD